MKERRYDGLNKKKNNKQTSKQKQNKPKRQTMVYTTLYRTFKIEQHKTIQTHE